MCGITGPVGHVDMPIVWQADNVTYVRALRWMLSGTKGVLGLMGRGKFVCWGSLISNFIF